MITNEGTLDDVYFEWLYGLVGPLRNSNPARNYWHLLRKLYTTEFTWSVPNDDNRVVDGQKLRLEFLDTENYVLDDPHDLWMNLGCSMLEMLIALARLAAFESDGSPVEWFWRFMHNLEFDRYSDDIYEISIEEEVEDTLARVIERTYSPNGEGGLFPLRDARYDQRDVELWYQLSAYLVEGLYVDTRPGW